MAVTPELKPSARRVQQAVEQRGFRFTVVEFAESTRTSQEAAAAIGCEVAQIAKSLVFRTLRSGQAVLVIASGVNRVDERRLADLLGDDVGRADADFVRAQTGYAIGGVPPVGHDRPLRTFLDEDLAHYAEIWAAAGTPNAVFRLTFPELVALTGGQVASLRKE
jgi:prolyl-tRNA editing enzyme YbaK/EbsC (Cys-tRNA(Pro) deacylase)